MDQVAENEVILAYRFLIVLLGYTLLYFVRSLIIYNDSMLLFARPRSADGSSILAHHTRFSQYVPPSARYA